MTNLVPHTIFLGGLAAAAWSDLRTRRIANELVLGIGIAGLVLHGSLLGALVGLAILFPAFAARWVGGADVKLLAAAGAWLGVWGIVVGAALGLALGGVLAIAMAIRNGTGRDLTATFITSLASRTLPVAPRRTRAMLVPLGVPLAAGLALAYAGVLS